jgi:hypothetical protein
MTRRIVTKEDLDSLVNELVQPADGRSMDEHIEATIEKYGIDDLGFAKFCAELGEQLKEEFATVLQRNGEVTIAMAGLIMYGFMVGAQFVEDVNAGRFDEVPS